ncbi:hypothetical protein AM493_19750 [Flavobacterium akiainvivens]|uniref:Uncharacterized protein n=1 Tax=Flavobacterium akiainvivens TaxID=1202724 RepID=A0A0M8MFW0_9FLAO|nr:hypothetical protein [Flavobacterium akiainvivens]KOS08034.1 hypothetical protein AM493_19750 [Flavobacterium akiainvivens]SFQ62222.1 hypothetical protein SAMN05444144_11096 [Flavobacterium akiainvivens]
MLSQLSIFKQYPFSEYEENGFDSAHAQYCYSLNPYSQDHYYIPAAESFVASYSFVQRGGMDFEAYHKYEQLYVTAFAEVFGTFDIIGVKDAKEVLYNGYAAFEADLLKALREDHSYAFVVNSLGLVIDCNFDLIVAVFGYTAYNERVGELLDIFRKHGLFVTDLKE